MTQKEQRERERERAEKVSHGVKHELSVTTKFNFVYFTDLNFVRRDSRGPEKERGRERSISIIRIQ